MIKIMKMPKWALDLYLKYLSLWNYAVVGAFGYVINTLILYALVTSLPLWLANAFAVIVAFLSNYTFSVGPLGWLFGLNKKEEKK